MVKPMFHIESRYCGPPGSGNGGYVCGRLAEHIHGTARVRLSVPPPLDVPLHLEEMDSTVLLKRRDQVIAQAWPHEFDLAVPACPSLAESRAMSRNYQGFVEHAFSTCFVCGPERNPGDGLRVFPGWSEKWNVVSSPWKPDPSLCDEDGNVRSWFVWAALDCPGGWSFLRAGGSAAVLGEFAVRIDEKVPGDAELITVGWELERAGRKHFTGSALLDQHGKVLARGKGTWFDIDPDRLKPS